MEDILSNVIKKEFNTDNFKIIERLLGGRSNYTYLIEVEGVKYTFRIPGENAEKFVDRNIEYSNLDLVNDLDINNGFVYFDLESGIKISKYIEGEHLSEDLYKDHVDQVVKVLKQLHSSKSFNNDYQPFKRLDYYEALCIDLGYIHSNEYNCLKSKYFEYKPYLLTNELVPCHNDTQLANFIIDHNQKLHLTDWEFAGNNDLYYDLACLADSNVNNALYIIPYYFNNPTNDDYKRVILWRIFQCLQWHNVATYKELIGLGKKLNIDFKFFADKYLDTVNVLFEMLKTYEN